MAVTVGQEGWFELPNGPMIEGKVTEVTPRGFTIKGKPLGSSEEERFYHFPVT